MHESMLIKKTVYIHFHSREGVELKTYNTIDDSDSDQYGI